MRQPREGTKYIKIQVVLAVLVREFLMRSKKLPFAQMNSLDITFTFMEVIIPDLRDQSRLKTRNTSTANPNVGFSSKTSSSPVF